MKKKKTVQKTSVPVGVLAIALLVSASALVTTRIAGDILAQTFNSANGQIDLNNGRGNDSDSLDDHCGDGVVDRDLGEFCDEGRENGKQFSTCSTCCIPKPYFERQRNKCDCGNDEKEWPEQCDHGEKNGKDGECNMFCQKIEDNDNDNDDDKDDDSTTAIPPECGNGRVESGEECDDGNGDNEDACTNECYDAECGDGILQSYREECDPGIDADCRADCTKPVPDPYCGDGVVDATEECDDGNYDDTDDCTSNCQATYCGDGIKQSSRGEECDLGSTNNGVDQVPCSIECKEINWDDFSNSSESSHSEESSESSQRDVIIVDPPRSNASVSDSNNDHDHDDDKDIIVTPPPPPGPGVHTHPSADEDEHQDSTETIEELRQKREAMQLKLEESMRRAREEAEMRQRELERQREEENQAILDSVEDAVEADSDLRCFNERGELTSDRSSCDSDQEKYLRPSEEISEEEVYSEISQKFLGDNAAETKRMELIQTLGSARSKLMALSEARNEQNSTQEVRDYLAKSVAWLDSSIEYFSAGPRNIDEIKQMAEPIRTLLTQARDVVQQEQNIVGQRVSIDPIVARTEKLLMKFRESFIALAHAGVQLDQDALGAYVGAAQQFNEIGAACTQNNAECGRLHEVLDVLKDAQGPLQEALDANPEVYIQLQEQFGN